MMSFPSDEWQSHLLSFEWVSYSSRVGVPFIGGCPFIGVVFSIFGVPSIFVFSLEWVSHLFFDMSGCPIYLSSIYFLI